jgi:histidinol-phosphate aminotransferase
MERPMTARVPRRGYEAIYRYSPDLAPCRVDLSDNTNAWGTPPSALEAIARSASVARYPTPYGERLKDALASYTGMPGAMIATGCGSDDILDCAMRAFAEPGDKVAYPAPTFVMGPAFAQLNGLIPVATPFAELPGAGRIVYVCSPNNPTGALTRRSDIEVLLAATDSDQVVIIDEAYFEFAGSTVVDLVERYDRLVVTRTMSKAFGLAGLRVGYAVAQPVLIRELEKARGPYKVSSVSEAAAVAALTGGIDWMKARAATAVEMREALAKELRRRGLEPLPSAANFLFVPLANAPAVGRRMRELGVAVRAFENPAGLRINVAPWEILEDALATLDQARRECA